MKKLKHNLLLAAASLVPIWAFCGAVDASSQENYTVFKLHSITPEDKQIDVTNDQLYIGVNGAPCQLVHQEAVSNIDPGVNEITFYTLKGFQEAFSLEGKITCLKFMTTYKGKQYTTGDIKLSDAANKIQATPQATNWNFTDK